MLVETALQPGATVAAAHVHPYQSERFQVLAGIVGMKVGRKKIEAGPGEVVAVAAGIAHKFYDAGTARRGSFARSAPHSASNS